MIFSFILYVEGQFYAFNGVRQFSPFSGWQLANNALYAYSHVDLPDTGAVPAQFKTLDSLARRSFRIMKRQGIVLNPYIKDFYIWGQGSPLGGYLKLKTDSTGDALKNWASVGPIYSAYGSYLVKRYPIEYFEYFFLPNVENFFSPAIADLYYYNVGSRRIDYRVVEWFGYKSNVMPPRKSYAMSILVPYPEIIQWVNVFFLVAVFMCFVFKEFNKASPAFRRLMVLVLLFWVLNLGFSCAASSVELRYQVFQFVLCFCFLMILGEVFAAEYLRRKHGYL